MSLQIYGIVADCVAMIHIAYAAIIVFGLVLILVGYFRGWKWIRNRWFRLVHLMMIAIVVCEAWIGMPCPLTVWEQQLREVAGQPFDGESFFGKAIHYLLFFDAPWWVFTAAYTLCGLLVLLTLYLVPPSWKKSVSPVDN